jgi:hypothetical protein
MSVLRPPPGLEPAVDGRGDEARLRVVVGHPFGLLRVELGQPLLDGARDSGVQLLPFALEQRRVGRFLHQSVPE